MNLDSEFDPLELVEGLRHTLARLEVALDAVDEAIVWVDGEGRVAWCNAAFDQLSGAMRIEILGVELAALLPLCHDDQPVAPDEHPARLVFARRGRVSGIYGIVAEPERFLDVQASPVRVGGERQAVLVFRDVSARVLADRETQRRADYVEMLREVAAHANEANDVQETMQHTLRCVAAHSRWVYGQAWMPDARTGELVACSAQVSPEKESFPSLRRASETARFSSGRGLPGEVVETRQPMWIPDLRAEGMALRGRLSETHGVRSAFAFPVLVGGNVRAVLEFFSAEVLPRDEVLLELAREVGAQLARVFERHDADVALRHANDDLESRVSARTAELGEALAMLEAERETLRMRERAIDASTEAIILCDHRNPWLPIEYVNAGFEQMFGYARNEILGQSALVLLGAEPSEDAAASLLDRIGECAAFTTELELVQRDGSRLWTRTSATPVRDPDGTITHWLIVESDITRAKEVDRLKSELVSTVSHELRTPLGSMCGFAELLLAREHPPARQRQFLNIILQEGRRLGTLIDDFLDIQRIESGKQTYRFERTPLLELVREAVAAFGGVENAHVVLEEPVGGLPQLMLDSPRIRQVLANLISNAVKFSPKGADVTVRFDRWGSWVRTSVVDKGVGIPAEAIPRLFTRFYRVDNRDTRAIGGTGLGLSLVKALVEAHSGHVGVESAVGEGSTFWFELPVPEAE